MPHTKIFLPYLSEEDPKRKLSGINIEKFVYGQEYLQSAICKHFSAARNDILIEKSTKSTLRAQIMRQ